MTKSARFLITGILIIGTLFLVYTHIGMAKNGLTSDEKTIPNVGELSMKLDEDEPGSVKPPSGKPTFISGPGNYSIGGVCILKVHSLLKGVTISTELLGIDSVGPLPGISRFLAGVCRVSFRAENVSVPGITSSQGSVDICFAAIPNVEASNRIFLDDTNDEDTLGEWLKLDTTVVDGQSCSPAAKTGKYVLSSED